MKYVDYINSILSDIIKESDETVLFGQNIDAGSCLSGLTRGLSEINPGITINTPNIENTLMGVGFGLMLRKVNSIFFMKQLDFLLLGIDQMVNTYNIIQTQKGIASFTVFPITVDSGYEGPQSSLNQIDEFCSISGVEAFSFTNQFDTKTIIEEYLIKPGFRILSTGQRLLKQKTLELEIIDHELKFRYFQYTKGNSLTIVCFNHALPYGVKIQQIFKEKGYSCSLFSINAHSYGEFEPIMRDISISKKLVLIDDSKSRNRLSDKFLLNTLREVKLEKLKIILPKDSIEKLFPNSDILEINYNTILEEMI